MIDVSGGEDKTLTIVMKNLRTEITLIQRLISNEKQYLKEAILKSDVFLKTLRTLKKTLKVFGHSDKARQLLETHAFNSLFQRMIFEFLNLLFTILQLSQL